MLLFKRSLFLDGLAILVLAEPLHCRPTFKPGEEWIHTAEAGIDELSQIFVPGGRPAAAAGPSTSHFEPSVEQHHRTSGQTTSFDQTGYADHGYYAGGATQPATVHSHPPDHFTSSHHHASGYLEDDLHHQPYSHYDNSYQGYSQGYGTSPSYHGHSGLLEDAVYGQPSLNHDGTPRPYPQSHSGVTSHHDTSNVLDSEAGSSTSGLHGEAPATLSEEALVLQAEVRRTKVEIQRLFMPQSYGKGIHLVHRNFNNRGVYEISKDRSEVILKFIKATLKLRLGHSTLTDLIIDQISLGPADAKGLTVELLQSLEGIMRLSHPVNMAQPSASSTNLVTIESRLFDLGDYKIYLMKKLTVKGRGNWMTAFRGKIPYHLVEWKVREMAAYGDIVLIPYDL